MHLAESRQYEREYHDPAKRTNANSVQAYFNDGSKTPLSEVLYPLGHRKRREEGIPVLMKKFEQNVARVFASKQRDAILAAATDQQRLEAMPVNEFVDLLAV
jgi:2-methylcitrate dehydratase